MYLKTSLRFSATHPLFTHGWRRVNASAKSKILKSENFIGTGDNLTRLTLVQRSVPTRTGFFERMVLSSEVLA